MRNVSRAKLTSMHFYGWKKGVKTGMYYLRTQAATDAIKFTVDAEMLEKEAAKRQAEMTAEANNKEECVACGS